MQNLKLKIQEVQKFQRKIKPFNAEHSLEVSFEEIKLDALFEEVSPLFGGIIGIDPGTTHLGVAIIPNISSAILIYEIQFARSNDAIERIDTVSLILQRLLARSSYEIAVEGASYGDNYRQVELAEVRAAIACYGISIGAKSIKFIPPSSVRKTVFGNGKMPAHAFWTELEQYPNAAAALSVALALKIKNDEVKEKEKNEVSNKENS